LRFEVDDIDSTLKSLADLGISPRRDAGRRASRSALLTAPEGTPLLLVAAK
jgi:hypothetical protein